MLPNQIKILPRTNKLEHRLGIYTESFSNEMYWCLQLILKRLKKDGLMKWTNGQICDKAVMKANIAKC